MQMGNEVVVKIRMEDFYVFNQFLYQRTDFQKSVFKNVKNIFSIINVIVITIIIYIIILS